MARFSNTPTKARPGPSNIQGIPSRTFEGGAGFVPGDPHVELFNAAVSGFLTDKFYESGDQRIARLVDLVPRCDPEWLQGFIPWLRNTANMRSASVVLAAEYGRSNFPYRRDIVHASLQRADEPGEMLGYWMSRYGRPIPSWLKRGVGDAVQRLYNERALLKYDGQGQGWRFADVIELVHPKPVAEWQSDLFRYALDRRHGDAEVPDRLHIVHGVLEAEALSPGARRAMLEQGRLPSGFTWERVAGWVPGGMDAAAWDAVIPQMGLFALVRNLNNFDRAGISVASRLLVQERMTNEEVIRSSRMMPFRFLTAYMNLEADTYKLPLGAAVDMSLGNLPRFSGKTLIMVDCSGSMGSPVGGHTRNYRGGPYLSLSRLAGFQAEVLARRCDEAMIVCYDQRPRSRHEPQGHVGVLTASATDVYRPGGATRTWECTEWAFRQERFDRVVIITDEQSHDRDGGRIEAPIITWNLAGYRPHHSNHGSSRRFLVSGVGDNALQMLPSLIQRSMNRWPWD